MRKRSILLFLITILIVPLVAVGILNFVESNFAKLPVYNRAHSLGNYHFINQNGMTKDTTAWSGKIVLVNFFFTHCPVVCPRMMSNLVKVHERYQSDTSLLFTSFTVDPERDSVSQLHSYAAQRKISYENWDLLTGNKKEIYALARNGFMVVATDGDGGADDFIHSDKVVLLDKKKNIRGYYDGTNSNDIDQLIKDIKKLENEK